MPLVFVDPAYTSQTCAECGHVDRRNRVDQGLFICRGAGALLTVTGMLPTTSPPVARACGMRGVSHASLPPRKGCWTGESTQRPAGHYLLARFFRTGSS
ncbi:zinc ribbon domain-containing protein [Streptomyces sp. NPDC127077]|uniref:zinc ribbon domain-containing protein n=1 Tax=Streptomyces sp. NPDC127077 TaxID=3347131 RepID=UPI00364AB712